MKFKRKSSVKVLAISALISISSVNLVSANGTYPLAYLEHIAMKSTSVCYKVNIAKTGVRDALSDLENVSSASSSLASAIPGFSSGLDTSSSTTDSLKSNLLALQQDTGTITKINTLYASISDAAKASVDSLNKALKNTPASKFPSGPAFDNLTAYKVYSTDEVAGWPSDSAGQSTEIRNLSEDLQTTISSAKLAYEKAYPLKAAGVLANLI